MSDLICRKSMRRCNTPGMCSPFGGCQVSILQETNVRYSASSDSPVSAVKRYHPNHPHIDGRDVVLASDYDAVAADLGERIYQNSTLIAKENDDLHAEVTGLTAERDALAAEVEALQAQVKALQSDANSYQSGHTAGRLSVKAHADNWRKQAERDAARLDWVAQQFRTCTVDMSGNHPYAPGAGVRDLRGPTFRAAVDAAMAQQEPSA